MFIAYYKLYIYIKFYCKKVLLGDFRFRRLGMASIYVSYIVSIKGVGNIRISLSRAKALKIINELNRLLPLKTRVFVRDNVPYIYLGVKKGGLSRGRCNEGVVFYDVIQDSLMICTRSFGLLSTKYVEVGRVEEGLELLKNLKHSATAIINRVTNE